MIKSLTVTNSLGESLTLELFNPWKNGIAIKSIEGLGTPEFDMNSQPYGSGDGSEMGSVKADSRTITITLWPMFHPQVEDSRQLLYRYFQVKKPIQLTFNLDNRVAITEGYVESGTPTIFSDCETIVYTIFCPDPYFRRLIASSSFFFGQVPLFEFPFSNESFTDKLLEMGRYSVDNRAQIDYDGEFNTGMTIIIDCYSPPGDIVIYNVETLGTIRLMTNRLRPIIGTGLIEKDRVEIGTELGNRYVRLLREGKYYNILGAVNRDIDWFQLKQGPNIYTYTTQDEHASIIMTFRYHSSYAAI